MHCVSSISTNQVSFLELPVAMEDFVTYCRRKDLAKIRLISEKLATAESTLITDKEAVRLLAEGCYCASLISINHHKPQTLVLNAFARTLKDLGGKLIFPAFVPEKDKFLEGAIFPIGSNGIVLIYLPAKDIPPKVMFSPNLKPATVRDFLFELNYVWKNQILNNLRR